MRNDTLRPVVWRGDLVALAGRERFHIISPRLTDPDASPDERAFVALLCLYHRQVLLGHLPASNDEAVGEQWANDLIDRYRAALSG